MQSTTYTIAAVNDEHTTCECCGRTGLKKTAQLINEAGDVKILGTTCAASFLGTDSKTNEMRAFKIEQTRREVIRRRDWGKTPAETVKFLRAVFPEMSTTQILKVFYVTIREYYTKDQVG